MGILHGGISNCERNLTLYELSLIETLLSHKGTKTQNEMVVS